MRTAQTWLLWVMVVYGVLGLALILVAGIKWFMDWVWADDETEPSEDVIVVRRESTIPQRDAS